MRLSLLGLLLFAACAKGGSKDAVLAAATIGPAGGEVGVDSGPFAGLRLTVQGGALTRDRKSVV